jgi:hypothetical protein
MEENRLAKDSTSGKSSLGIGEVGKEIIVSAEN